MLTAAVLLCFGLGACSRADSEAAKVQLAVPVVVAHAQVRTVPLDVAAVGTVEPVNSVQVKSLVDGQLTEAPVKDGQEVEAGDLLFRIDPRPIQAQLDQARATFARDRATLAQAQAEEKRYSAVAAKGFVSADQLDQVRTAEQVALAALKVDQANIEGFRLQLGYTEIRAPIDGRVGRILVQPGNLVKANDTNALLVINQIAPIYVTFGVPQRLLGAVQAANAKGPLAVGAKADGVPKPESGRLAFIDNAVDSTSGTVKLRANFANADRALWPGQFVKVTLDLGNQQNDIVVPDTAVQAGPEGSYVFVVGADGKAEQRTVQVARSQGGYTVITDGIKAGDSVVVDGQSRLVNGAPVSIAKSTQ